MIIQLYHTRVECQQKNVVDIQFQMVYIDSIR